MEKDFHSCRRCGRISEGPRQRLCHACLIEERVSLRALKDFLEMHPTSTYDEAVESLKIDTHFSTYFLDNGLLDSIEVGVNHPCRICGETITAGILCQGCDSQFHRVLEDLQASVRKKRASETVAAPLVTEKNGIEQAVPTRRPTGRSTPGSPGGRDLGGAYRIGRGDSPPARSAPRQGKKSRRGR